MKNIEELVEIIKKNGGAASLSEIVKGYQRIHPMVILDVHRKMIKDTLLKNPQLVRYIEKDGTWAIGHNEPLPEDTENLIGSPFWFCEKAKDKEVVNHSKWTDEIRNEFMGRFSPEKLRQMSGMDLLQQVFGNGGTMLDLLMKDDTYRCFGAAGKYQYLRIVYHRADGKWAYNKNNKVTELSKENAEQKAIEIRDLLIAGVDIVSNHGEFNNICDYEQLDNQFQTIFFSNYAWVLKYYHMLFPEVFPQMYADHTIETALRMMGLPIHGHNRIINMGELSLYIKKCGIDNTSFNRIYGNQWSWREDSQPSEYARSKKEIGVPTHEKY